MADAQRRIELNCPVGSVEAIDVAADNGGDAVYFGVRLNRVRGLFHVGLSLRPDIFSFTVPGARRAVRHARSRGLKVQIALNNILGCQSALDRCVSVLDGLGGDLPDAVIVTNPGLMALIHERYPAIAIHASIMMGTSNVRDAVFLASMGVKRVILERHLTLDDVAAIKRHAGIEVEVFGFGSYCYSYHSFCFASSYFHGDMCRGMGFCLRPYAHVTAEGIKPRTYFLSKTLSVIRLLPGLGSAGVDSIKIEGRVCRARAMAPVIRAFREAMDAPATDGASRGAPCPAALHGESFTEGFLSNAALGQESLWTDGVRGTSPLQQVNRSLTWRSVALFAFSQVLESWRWWHALTVFKDRLARFFSRVGWRTP